MRDAMVHEIYDRAWKLGELDPLPNAPPLERLLQVVGEEGVPLRADPGSEVEGGPYDGGHVITVLTRDRPMYFLMPPEAIPLLEPYMDAGNFEEMRRRTPRLHGRISS